MSSKSWAMSEKKKTIQKNLSKFLASYRFRFLAISIAQILNKIYVANDLCYCFKLNPLVPSETECRPMGNLHRFMQIFIAQ